MPARTPVTFDSQLVVRPSWLHPGAPLQAGRLHHNRARHAYPLRERMPPNAGHNHRAAKTPGQVDL
ncbi:MAG TPA: hypothetical protein VGM03_23480, partial [Phycisphaerae bacterium]